MQALEQHERASLTSPSRHDLYTIVAELRRREGPDAELEISTSRAPTFARARSATKDDDRRRARALTSAVSEEPDFFFLRSTVSEEPENIF